MSVVIVDTGCANLASVGFAFQRLGAQYTITQDQQTIQAASKVILPGVGAMPFAMEQLRARGLIEVLHSLTQPVLGICLGLQLLFERSAEGNARGLGLIEGKIRQMETGDLPAPHMGWNTLEDLGDDPLLDGVQHGEYVYFVHSYCASIGKTTLATAIYGQPFSAIVRQDNIYGCQFHPERSGKTGARILENFLKVQT